MRDAPLTRAEQVAAAAGTLAPAGIALICLLAAWLGEPLLVRATGARPMAPITALALLALSGAFGLLQARPARLATRAFVAFVTLGLATAVALLGTRTWVLPTQSRDWQTWLTSGAAQVEGLQPVHMAPGTAAMLALAALSLLALTGRDGGPVRRAGLAAAVLVAMACGVTAAGQAIGLSLFLAGGDRPMSPWAAAALTALSAALALRLGLKGACYKLLYGRAWLSTETLPSGERRARRLLTGGLLALVGSSLFLGIGYLRLHSRQVRAGVGRELTAVAELRAGAIAAWRHERLADARTLMRAPLLADTGRGGRADPAAGRQRLVTYLDGFRSAYGYASLTLFDTALQPTFVSPAGSATARTGDSGLLQAARTASDAIIGDLQRSADGSTGLELITPVLAADGKSFGGAVRLRVDVDASLFALLSGWPTKSETAESLLFRRQGEALLYLSPLRHRATTTTGLALPRDEPGLLAAAARPPRGAGLIEGIDYRGVPGLAVALDVPESPWVLLAKVDRQEAYEPVRDESERVVAGLALLLALGVTGAGLLWRQRQHELITRQWNTERARVETLEKLDLVMRHANDGIVLLDESLHVVEANDRAAALYGYPPDELLRLALWDLRAPEAHATVAADLARGAEPGGHVFETIHVRKDGTTFPVEVSSRQVEIGARAYRLSLIRDISERKAHERQLERLNRMYLALSRINEAIVRARDSLELKRLVCRILVESGGFKLTWVGWLDGTGSVVPQASFGDESGYVERITVTVDGRPAGRGPTGSAIREGRTCVSNDFLSDPSTSEWRELAERSGLCASIAIPLRERGRVSGALMAYAAQRDFFGSAEIRLLEETASDLSFALDVLARDEDRRAAEAALEASESRLWFLVSATPAILCTCRASDWALTFISENVSAVLGHSPGDFLENPGFWLEHLHPDDVSATLASSERLSPSAPLVREYRLRHRDGSYRWVRDELRVEADAEGRPLEIIGCWTDVTGRKRAELELQVLLEIALGLVETAGPRAFLELVHRSLARVIYAENLLALLHDPQTGLFEEIYLADRHDLPSPPAELGRSLCAYAFRRGEALIVDPESFAELEARGEVARVGTRSLSWLGAPLRSGDRVIGVIAVQDYETRGRYGEADREFLVSVAAHVALAIERHAAQQALLDNDARFREAQQIAHIGVWDLDLQRNRLVWSDEIYRLFGLEPGSFAATYEAFLDAIHPEDRERVDRAYKESLVARAPYQIEHRLLLKDGSVRHVRERCETWFDDEGRPRRSLGTVQDVTQSMQLTQELRTSESRYRLIAENTADVIWIYDLAADRFSYVSPSVERLLGFAAEEVIGRGMREVLTPASMAMVALDLPRRLEALARGDESARTQVDDIEQVRRDGHAVPTESVSTLLSDPDGRVSGILGVSRDVTERKQADDALHERVRQLRTLHAISQTIAQRELDLPTQLARIVQDLPAIMLFPQDAQARIELRGETRTGGQGGALQECLSETILVGGQPAGSVSVGYVRPPGSAPARPIPAEKREILQSVARMLGTGLEAREAFAGVEETVVRRTAELADRSRQVQGLLQAIPDMVLRLRADGTLLSCQPASGSARLAQHCRPRETDLGDCLSDQLRAPVVSVGRRALGSASTVTEEVELGGPDGTLALELRAAPVGPEEFVAFVRDITERKHLESEIAASLERERQISEMKSRFISVTSHEFRTPMAAVIGSTELLQNHLERLAPGKRDELFARIKGSLRRMTEMLDDLLLVNRIDAGRVEPQWAAVDLRSFVRGIVEEIQLGDRDAHRFVVETTGEARAFATDANLLHHVLANLLSNAARYSPGGSAITTRLGYERERVVLSVEDQGIGVPEADRQRIFEPFERGSNVGTIKGTGLGLNIVKRMTALLGGHVGVSEAPGGGSRFELVFPTQLRGA